MPISGNDHASGGGGPAKEYDNGCDEALKLRF